MTLLHGLSDNPLTRAIGGAGLHIVANVYVQSSWCGEAYDNDYIQAYSDIAEHIQYGTRRLQISC